MKKAELHIIYMVSGGFEDKSELTFYFLYLNPSVQTQMFRKFGFTYESKCCMGSFFLKSELPEHT